MFLVSKIQKYAEDDMPLFKRGFFCNDMSIMEPYKEQHRFYISTLKNNITTFVVLMVG